MLRSSLVSACSLLLCATATAQSTLETQRVPAQPKNAGVYHWATGTWTRGAGSANLGPDVLYANTCNTGYYVGVSPNLDIIDHGRIPSTSAPAPTGNSNTYTVNGFQTAYCASNVSALTSFTYTFWESYQECSDVGANPAPLAQFVAAGVFPGSPVAGTLACWIVTVNLENTTGEFTMRGDGDGTFNNDATDKFGYGQTISAQGGATPAGPIMAGHCDPVGPAAGSGTKFLNPGGFPGCTLGLGTNDFFWIDDSAAVPITGCYFFGGCNTQTGPGANPYASFWLALFGDKSGGAVGTNYCVSNANSVSAGGSSISATGSASAANPNLLFSASPVPNTSGLFFVGDVMLAGMADLGEGQLCAGGNIKRYAAATASGNTATRTVTNVPNTVAGNTRHFQYWHRETMAAGDLDMDGIAEGNCSSNGLSILFN